jgi:uncharacterized membrane protein
VSNAQKIFTKSLCKEVESAIEKAEIRTSGEIVVHVENSCTEDPYKHAIKVFETLGLHNTELRNGVLIYISLENHKLVILGDSGIHQFIHPDGWDALVQNLGKEFAAGRYQQGLCEVIEKIAEKLALHFPRFSHDKNELSNAISFAK